MKKAAQASVITGIVALTPLFAFAQFGEIDAFIGNINLFINQWLIPLVFAIALLVFLWGVFTYFIKGGGDPDSRKEGVQLMLYAVIGFVLMVSIFGIVNLISSGLNLNQQDIDSIPNAPIKNN